MWDNEFKSSFCRPIILIDFINRLIIQDILSFRCKVNEQIIFFYNTGFSNTVQFISIHHFRTFLKEIAQTFTDSFILIEI